jgi:hypothetical protein
MIISESEKCGKSELDLFSLPPTQTVMEAARWDQVQPYSNCRTGTVILDINGDNQCYIDLSQTELFLKCVLMKGGAAVKNLKAAPYTGAGAFGPVNNLLHSMFSQMQVKIGGVEVENTNSLYPYRAMYENLLCYGTEAKSTLLTMEGWEKDTAGQHDVIVDTTAGEVSANKGWLNRRLRYRDYIGFEFKGKLKGDMFNLGRYILPMVNVNVILTRAPLAFCFMGAEDVTGLSLEITECHLQVVRQ